MQKSFQKAKKSIYPDIMAIPKDPHSKNEEYLLNSRLIQRQ
jgi:hypothetical protein